MHGLIGHLLKLHRIFRDGDVAWCRKTSLLDDLPIAKEAERLEAGSFVVVDSLLVQLLLNVIEIPFGDVEDVVDVDFHSVLRFIFCHDVGLLMTCPTEHAKKRVDVKIRW